MKVLCVFGEHNYGRPERGDSYEYCHFVPALKKLGHEVVFFDTLQKERYRDFSDLNRRLLERVDAERPEIIFFVLLGYEVWTETLQLIAEGSSAALINWGTDDSWKYASFSRFLAPFFDLYTTTDRSAKARADRDGLDNFLLTQWAADSGRLQRPLPAAACRYDISFIGSCYGDREKWITALREQGYGVETFGHGWPAGPLASDEMASVVRSSVISLNLSSASVSGKGARQIKARVFEVPGAGGLLLTQSAEHIEEYYLPDKEIVIFDTVEELLQQVNRLMSAPEERDRIAEAGYRRTEREHNYEDRLAPLLAAAQARRRLRPAGTGRLDMSRFERVARAHQAGVFLRLLAAIIRLPCLMIWGRQRGPRAARRLLFELCWRLSGGRVYSARGLPGRIFYHDS